MCYGTPIRSSAFGNALLSLGNSWGNSCLTSWRQSQLLRFGAPQHRKTPARKSGWVYEALSGSCKYGLKNSDPESAIHQSEHATHSRWEIHGHVLRKVAAQPAWRCSSLSNLRLRKILTLPLKQPNSLRCRTMLVCTPAIRLRRRELENVRRLQDVFYRSKSCGATA